MEIDMLNLLWKLEMAKYFRKVILIFSVNLRTFKYKVR